MTTQTKQLYRYINMQSISTTTWANWASIKKYSAILRFSRVRVNIKENLIHKTTEKLKDISVFGIHVCLTYLQHGGYSLLAFACL